MFESKHVEVRPMPLLASSRVWCIVMLLKTMLEEHNDSSMCVIIDSDK